jgi:hypothetical protein
MCPYSMYAFVPPYFVKAVCYTHKKLITLVTAGCLPKAFDNLNGGLGYDVWGLWGSYVFNNNNGFYKISQVCDCLLMPATACNCLQLPATASNCLQLPATACNCLQLPATACNCLQLPATACNCREKPSFELDILDPR